MVYLSRLHREASVAFVAIQVHFHKKLTVFPICCDTVHTMNNSTGFQSDALASSPRDELRLRVMRLLEEHPEMSQRAIARELGVSLGGVNYALKSLIGRGYVKAGNFPKSDNKSAYLYLLTASGLAQKSTLATSFLSRKLKECEELKEEIETLKREVSSEQSAGS